MSVSSSIDALESASPNSIGEQQKIEFLKIEYQEAAKAYSLGVQAGQDFMRQFFYGNGFLAAFFAAIGFSTHGQDAAKLALKVIPIVAILASGVLLSTIPHYRRLLNSCRDRCAEIEVRFGGKLYTDIGKIRRNARFGAVIGLSIICIIFVIFWVAMLFVGIRMT